MKYIPIEWSLHFITTHLARKLVVLKWVEVLKWGGGGFKSQLNTSEIYYVIMLVMVEHM